MLLPPLPPPLHTWVWPHEGSVRHVDDADEDEDDDTRHRPSPHVVHGVEGRVPQSHVHQSGHDKYQRRHGVGPPEDARRRQQVFINRAR